MARLRATLALIIPLRSYEGSSGTVVLEATVTKGLHLGDSDGARLERVWEHTEGVRPGEALQASCASGGNPVADCLFTSMAFRTCPSTFHRYQSHNLPVIPINPVRNIMCTYASPSPTDIWPLSARNHYRVNPSFEFYIAPT